MTPLRIYIASASAEALEVGKAIYTLEQSGHYRVTHDWPKEVLAAKGGPNVEAQRLLTPTERHRIAQVDLHAVISADVIWLRIPDSVSYGCWVEWGAACVASRLLPRTLVVSGDTAKCLFTQMGFIYPSHEKCLFDLLASPEGFNPKVHLYAGSADRIGPGSGMIR